MTNSIVIPVEDWKWCQVCEESSVTCPKCHNSTCNGGGCDFCMNDPYFVKAHEMYKAGENPDITYFSDEEIYPFYLWKPEEEWNEEEKWHVQFCQDSAYTSIHEWDFWRTAWGWTCLTIRLEKNPEFRSEREPMLAYYVNRMERAWGKMTKQQRALKCCRLFEHADEGTDQWKFLNQLVSSF